ncbi:MAG TPA: M55 family metallopeptidase [Acidimicrobiales bacterium]|nr:M55 family metallopeptidase [Acidimicrobiales bacterium]
MKVHISVDMEGVAGVADAADTTLGAPHYEYCRRLMTAEANAAIEGCFEAGASEVIVNDSHGTMLNLLQEELDPRARVIRGRTKPLGMMQGIDHETAATLFVGYHAASGHGDGVLNHTMRSRTVHDVFLNGEPAGELRLNAALAGSFGVPVALVSGDDVCCEEARDCLGDVEAVEVKQAIDKYSAASLHPTRAQELIKDGTRRALGRLAELPVYRVEEPATLRVGWISTAAAALCENLPGLKRVGSREVEYTSGDVCELYRLLRALLAVAASVAAGPYTYD